MDLSTGLLAHYLARSTTSDVLAVARDIQRGYPEVEPVLAGIAETLGMPLDRLIADQLRRDWTDISLIVASHTDPDNGVGRWLDVVQEQSVRLLLHHARVLMVRHERVTAAQRVQSAL